MITLRLSVTALGVMLAGLILVSPTVAAPSQGFIRDDDDIFDNWQVCRTRAYGQDGFFQITEGGFRPVITFESLGENADVAYRFGQQFASNYPDRHQRAEAIFYFVRNHIHYTPDIDQFHFEDFAQNADELILAVEQGGFAGGDCEDMATLLAVMYKGAGYQSAIVLAPGHAATLVYLPGYPRATTFFNVNGKPGWVWAEATGRNNPLGWVPKDCISENLAAYEISAEPMPIPTEEAKPTTNIAKKERNILIEAAPFLAIVGLMGIIPMFRRRH